MTLASRKPVVGRADGGRPVLRILLQIALVLTVTAIVALCILMELVLRADVGRQLYFNSAREEMLARWLSNFTNHSGRQMASNCGALVVLALMLRQWPGRALAACFLAPPVVALFVWLFEPTVDYRDLSGVVMALLALAAIRLLWTRRDAIRWIGLVVYVGGERNEST